MRYNDRKTNILNPRILGAIRLLVSLPKLLKISFLCQLGFTSWSMFFTNYSTAADFFLDTKVISSSLSIERRNFIIANDDWDWLKRKEVLTVGVSEEEAEPFRIFEDPDKYEGISADVTALVSQLLGLKVKLIFYKSNSEAFAALRDGLIDVVSSHDQSYKAEGLVFSKPYASDELIVFKRNGDKREIPADLAGVTVSTTYEHFSEIKEKYPNARITVYKTHDQAIAATAFGDSQVYLDDVLSAYYRINRSFYGYLRIVRFSELPIRHYSFAFRNDNKRLQSIINTGIETIGADRLSRISERWTGSGPIPTYKKVNLTTDEYRWLNKNPVVRLLVTDDMAPLAFFDSENTFSGVVSDLLENITLNTGLRFEVISNSDGYDGQIEALRKKEGDISIMTASPHRENYLRFSYPLMSSQFVFLTNRNHKVDLNDMAGLRLALPRGHVGKEKLSLYYPGLKIIEVNSTLDAMNLLFLERADIAVAPLPSARYYNNRFFKDRLLTEKLVDIGPATANFSFRRSDPELRSIINKALENIPPDELNAIVNRWRSLPGMSGETWRDYDLLISRIILISVLIFAVSLIWIFYLRHEVKSRKKAELMLDEQLQFIQTLSDSMPPALYVRDKKGVLISCNRSYLDSLGLKKENVLGKTAKQLPQIISESASEFHNAYFQAMQDGQTVVSVRCMHLLGKEVWVEHWIQPYRDSHGLIQGVICGWIDITEYRKVVRKLEAANKEADDASRAKTNFVATMSHEIRTPMSAIISILELELKRSSNSYIDRSSIEIAHNSAKNLLELIGEILDIARIESGRLSICPKRANVYELIEAVARVFEGLAAQKSLKLILDIDVSINTDVLIDAMRFKQILSNLVSNAIKFTEEGYVKISAIGNFIDTSKLSVKMTVEDSGAGICQADQKKLFHPFSQVSNNIHNTNGAGLGLVICRSLCEMMGGKINVVSELGRGTKVEYELFFSTLDKTIEPIRLPIFQPGLPRLRLQVLIVDDHKVNRTVLQQQLSFLGHDVIEAEDGSQAFNAWLDQDFDIIITDCHMPIMNGVQLTASIREAEAVKGDDPVIIIGLTADAQAEEVQMCIDAGMNDCLIKPIELEKLEALLSLSQTQLDNYTNMSGDSELLASDKATDNPLLDSNILDFLRQTDSTMLSKILRELVLSNRLDVDQLKSLAKNLNLNLNSILELSHRMKGAARMVGCHILVDSCNDLESECLSSNPDNVKINLKIEKIVRVVFELESLIECMSLQG